MWICDCLCCLCAAVLLVCCLHALFRVAGLFIVGMCVDVVVAVLFGCLLVWFRDASFRVSKVRLSCEGFRFLGPGLVPTRCSNFNSFRVSFPPPHTTQLPLVRSLLFNILGSRGINY